MNDLARSMPLSTRPYRARNRRQPCNRCRRRKVRCEPGSGLSCQSCERDDDASCSLLSDHNNTTWAEPAATSPATTQETALAGSSSPGDPPGRLECFPESTPTAPWPAPQMDDIFSNQAPPTQISQSLDNVEDHLYQLSGASSDADPWLLRHCKFDDYGVRRLFKVHIRNAGGVPTREKIPAHFLVGERVVYDAARHEAGIDRHHDLRTELARLVPPSHGPRLVRLFMKRVYPLVPVLSRSGMNLDAVHGLPSLEDLNGIPAHLLAAIYGSALPFASEDSFLYLMTSHEKPPMSKIWFMVYKFICENIHSPRLSLIQASILYIHRHVEDEHSYGVADTASVWSIIGMTVGLAHSLGLNLECRLFGLPHEEKSLRRRLWWALYIEDKWASLLFGRPPYIRSSEWDVSEPDDSDFVTTSERDPRSAADVSISFRHMASLAVIAESIQDGLYSLRASQKLSEDIPASVAAAKPLLQSLSAWRESLPLVGGHHSLRETAAGTQGPFPATIYQGYLTLLVYIWRALLRTTVRSTDPPVVIHVDDLPESANLLRDVDWGLHLLPDLNIEVQESRGVQSGIVKDLYEAALTCGSNVLDFLSGLDSHAFHEFWYSWSRKSFATISNFLTLLLVQAPDFSEAVRAKGLLENWQKFLCSQHRAFPMLSQAKIRLDSYNWNGLEQTFHLATHVQQALHQTD